MRAHFIQCFSHGSAHLRVQPWRFRSLFFSCPSIFLPSGEKVRARVRMSSQSFILRHALAFKTRVQYTWFSRSHCVFGRGQLFGLLASPPVSVGWSSAFAFFFWGHFISIAWWPKRKYRKLCLKSLTLLCDSRIFHSQWQCVLLLLASFFFSRGWVVIFPLNISRVRKQIQSVYSHQSLFGFYSFQHNAANLWNNLWKIFGTSTSICYSYLDIGAHTHTHQHSHLRLRFQWLLEPFWG